MNIEAWEVLNKITKKEIHELREDEIAFLRARRSYLTDEQKEQYKELLEEDLVSYNDLLSEARELGLKTSPRPKREDLIKMIEEKRGEAKTN